MMESHALRAHEDYAASAADQWMNCAGSISLCAGLPEQRSAYAEEGTRAHEVLQNWLEGVQPSLVAADEEMRDGIMKVLDYVAARRAEHPNLQIWIEQRVKVSSRAAPDRVGGTSDIILYYPDLKMLEVIDFKYGEGVAVDVIGNKQMRVYALGAYEQLLRRGEI